MRACSRTRCLPSCGTGSSSSRRRSSRSSPSTAASSRVVRSTTTRSSGSSARATTRPSAARPGRRRRRSGRVVADDVRELARLTQRAARTLGFRDWFALSVATSEMDETAALRDARRVRPAHRRRLRDVEGRDGRAPRRAVRLRARPSCGPWHYEDPFFQEVPAAGGVDLTDRLRGRRTSSSSPARPSRRSGSTRRRSSAAATCSPATASASTRSASTSTARATCACSQRRARPLLGGHDAPRARARRLRHRLRRLALVAPARLPPDDDRGHRDPDGPPRAGGRVAARRRRRRRGRGRAARRPAPGRARGRAARLHPLGARDDELRARVLRRPGGRPRRDLVGPRRPLPAADAARGPGRSPTGPRRSTSPARPSTTTPTSTGTSSPASSARRSTRGPAASSGGPRRERSSGGASSGPASPCAGTRCSSRPPASR